MTAMTSSIPYLLRAINEWILDNNQTPYLVVDAETEGTDVPSDYVNDGQIVLNISPSAVRALEINNQCVTCSGRFSGMAYEVYVPMKAILGIIAKENGEGMWFPREESDATAADKPAKGEKPADDDPDDDGPKGPPSLRVVK